MFQGSRNWKIRALVLLLAVLLTAGIAQAENNSMHISVEQQETEGPSPDRYSEQLPDPYPPEYFKAKCDKLIEDSVGHDYFVEHYKFIGMKYNPIIESYIIHYDYTADTGDVVEMSAEYKKNTGERYTGIQSLLLEPQRVTVTRDKSIEIALEYGINHNISVVLGMSRVSGFNGLFWTVSQAPSESTHSTDNRTITISADAVDEIMLWEFGDYASGGCTPGNACGELLNPPIFLKNSSFDMAPIDGDSLELRFQTDIRPMGGEVSRVYSIDSSKNEQKKFEIGESLYYATSVHNSDWWGTIYVDVYLESKGPTGTAACHWDNQPIGALRTVNFYCGPVSRSKAGKYTVTSEVYDHDGPLLSSGVANYYVVFSSTTNNYLGTDCCGVWPFQNCYHNPEDEYVLDYGAYIINGETNAYNGAEEIVSWVSRNIRYDSSDGGRTKDVDLLYDIRTDGYATGDCNDYADLYIGLARAVNIPSRLVMAAVIDANAKYSEEFPDYGCRKHNGHTLAESYINRWIHVEPQGAFDNPTMYGDVIVRACTANPGDCSDCRDNIIPARNLENGYIDITRGQQGVTYDSDPWSCSSDATCCSNSCEGSQSQSHSARCCWTEPWSDGYYCGSGNVRQYRDYYCSSSGNIYYETISSYDCDNDDGWYDSGGWSCDGSCRRKKNQQYRDYYCSGSSCTYSVTNTRVIYENCDAGKSCSGGTCSSSYRCDSTFECSPGSGNNNYGYGGRYRCQGSCDGSNHCDYAVNCQDCGTDYCTSWSNFCSNNDLWRSRTCHDRGCSSGICFDDTDTETQTVQDCGTDSCSSWSGDYCKNDDVYKSRTCYDRGCFGISCYENQYTDETKVEECGSAGCQDGECKLAGDINGDCIVNIMDLSVIAQAFGAKPGDSDWNPNADVIQDGIINIFDLSLVGQNFGNTC